MKRTAVIVILSLLAAFVFSACAPAAPSGQTPEFLNDIGKTLIELKNEHPEGEIIESLDSSPDWSRRRNMLITFSERRAAILKRP